MSTRLCKEVAQISNLPYRKIPFCWAPADTGTLEVPSPADWKSAIQQIGNLRYEQQLAPGS